MKVGIAMKQAYERAEWHRASLNGRTLAVRVGVHQGAADTSPEAFVITARIAAGREDAEAFNAGKCRAERCIPWEELDDRADEIPVLLDEAIWEVRRNMGLAGGVH